jgi:hypothetical protein
MSDDLSKKKELSDAASGLLSDKAFLQAILSLRKRWFDQLMGDLKAKQQAELVAMLKALDTIPAELGTIINDYKMAMNRQQKHG